MQKKMAQNTKILEVSEKSAAIVEKAAAESGMTKQEVIDWLLTLHPKPEQPKREKIDEIRALRGGGNGGEKKDTVEKLIDMKWADKILGDGGGSSSGMFDKEMFKGMMQMQYYSQAMQAMLPQQQKQDNTMETFEGCSPFAHSK